MLDTTHPPTPTQPKRPPFRQPPENLCVRMGTVTGRLRPVFDGRLARTDEIDSTDGHGYINRSDPPLHPMGREPVPRRSLLVPRDKLSEVYHPPADFDPTQPWRGRWIQYSPVGPAWCLPGAIDITCTWHGGPLHLDLARTFRDRVVDYHCDEATSLLTLESLLAGLPLSINPPSSPPTCTWLEQLFDLSSPDGDGRDVIAEHPEVAARLRALLDLEQTVVHDVLSCIQPRAGRH